ncbi:MAG: thioredoxin-disulfide reductase [[Clostridium] fimetarium]|nr:thioredoxin-disulfide reductase [Alistipes timonensis]MCM1406397.1 thioredoxin-disulfide reductase [[Clostridium] fimetarium]
MNEKPISCAIIGAGPAGYTAAIYASRANLAPVLFEGMQPGGQLTTTTEVENFPGYPQGVNGPEMMGHLREQALRFGTDIRTKVIADVDFNTRPFKLTTDSGEVVEALTVIIATGASARYLGLPDEQKYLGMGVSACATCDGFFYRGRRVAVVGGGDTACEEALYLSTIAKEVYLIVRKPYLRASKVMQNRLTEAPNITILYNTVTEGLYGEEVLEGARLVENAATDTERRYELPIDGFFLAIGHTPNTTLFEGKLALDEQGYIVVNSPSTRTSVPGVFAAGDVADPFYRQAINAAGSGCRAALDADRFLQELR